ncbi:SIR2 family protein [Methanosphaera stadtmanae]|uniref:SIR2 family protein n=1 Tax=Methanosphaera stadtmanae TaxID=2317 RepID=UPI002E7774C0|nr:SIR2 family protein [Methanosphaera stadtmanae]MEE0490257.1 SIR2 family protein [Methanosphaera stadtmanae]
MEINEFIKNYKTHPVLFIGTGISLRYLKTSYNWEGLLEKIAYELYENKEKYLDLKSQSYKNGKYDLQELAYLIEQDFEEIVSKNRHGKFEDINDIFYKKMKEDNIKTSRFKIYISKILEDISIKDEMIDEIIEFKKIRKNIGSIITTNYDKLIEEFFDFTPLVGNDILLSNPYGSLYKIHGCIDEPEKIVITKSDYEKFDKKYELIRAQLLSIFIHNPIIFMGYSLGDQNIKKILNTIFSYIEPNSEQAEKIRSNFLLIEYKAGSNNKNISEHDIDMEGFSTIRINKLKTDDYISIYKALSDLQLPISAMDIRKVQTVVKDIYSGGNIKVAITDDIDNLRNSDKVLAIGSFKSIRLQYNNASEIMSNYFNIIEESNAQALSIIDALRIQSNQYFPIFGFKQINNNLNSIEALEKQQITKLNECILNTDDRLKTDYNTIEQINSCEEISNTNKPSAILWSILKDKINLKEIEEYLKSYDDKNSTVYKRILCGYDYKKYSSEDMFDL